MAPDKRTDKAVRKDLMQGSAMVLATRFTYSTGSSGDNATHHVLGSDRLPAQDFYETRILVRTACLKILEYRIRTIFELLPPPVSIFHQSLVTPAPVILQSPSEPVLAGEGEISEVRIRDIRRRRSKHAP